MIINPEAPPAPLSLDAIFASVEITQPERKRIQTVRDRIADAYQVVDAYLSGSRAERLGRTAPAVVVATAAAEQYRANPSAENAESYHAAILFAQDLEITYPAIARECSAAVSILSAGLADLIASIGERAMVALEAAAKTHRAGLEKSNVIFGIGNQAREFDERMFATRAALKHEIAEAQRDPLAWLTARNIGNP